MYNINISFDKNNPIIEFPPYPDSLRYGIYRGVTREILEKIAETNLRFYRDSDVNIMEKNDNVKYYYQISSIQEDKEVIFSTIEEFKYDIPYPVMGVLKETIRRGNIMLDLAGEEVTFYIRKSAGIHCEECYDEISQSTDTTKPLCLSCYNTGYKGGYEQLTGLFKIRNNIDDVKTYEWGIKLESNKTGWLTNYPIIHNGDFIRTKYGEIYIVSGTKHKRTKGMLTHQNCSLELLETSHPYYSI